MSMQNNGVSRRDILAGAAAATIAASPLAANAEVEYPNVPFREFPGQNPYVNRLASTTLEDARRVSPAPPTAEAPATDVENQSLRAAHGSPGGE